MAADIAAPREETLKVSRPDGQALLLTSNNLVSGALALTIDSNEMYAVAGEELIGIQRKYAELDEQEKGLTGPLLKVVEDIRALFRAPKQRLEEGSRALKGAMSKFITDQQAAERKVREEAEAVAKRQREEAEARAREEQQRAQELEQAGDQQAAAQAAQRATAARLESQVVSAPAVAASAAPKVAGISTRKQWRCALPESDEDKIAALRFIADHPEYLGLVEFSQKTANQLATAQRKAFAVPGLRAYEDTVIAGSRK